MINNVLIGLHPIEIRKGKDDWAMLFLEGRGVTVTDLTELCFMAYFEVRNINHIT